MYSTVQYCVKDFSRLFLSEYEIPHMTHRNFESRGFKWAPKAFVPLETNIKEEDAGVFGNGLSTQC